jgi:hypothetical protein
MNKHTLYRPMALAALIGYSSIFVAHAQTRGYVETDLVVNKQVNGAPTLVDSNGITHIASFFDPNLVNPWGLTSSLTGAFGLRMPAPAFRLFTTPWGRHNRWLFPFRRLSSTTTRLRREAYPRAPCSTSRPLPPTNREGSRFPVTRHLALMRPRPRLPSSCSPPSRAPLWAGIQA